MDRFWAKVQKGDGCWLWTGASFTTNGIKYGSFRLNGRQHGAHRIAWMLTHGCLPVAGLMVCHSCDNGLCVNPGHLFVGTTTENMRDMVSKGRSASGPRNSQTKLTPDAVRIIRERYQPKLAVARALAAEYGVSEKTIRNVGNRVFYRGVA